jgi:hypothetical protein
MRKNFVKLAVMCFGIFFLLHFWGREEICYAAPESKITNVTDVEEILNSTLPIDIHPLTLERAWKGNIRDFRGTSFLLNWQEKWNDPQKAEFRLYFSLDINDTLIQVVNSNFFAKFIGVDVSALSPEVKSTLGSSVMITGYAGKRPFISTLPVEGTLISSFVKRHKTQAFVIQLFIASHIIDKLDPEQKAYLSIFTADPKISYSPAEFENNYGKYIERLKLRGNFSKVEPLPMR